MSSLSQALEQLRRGGMVILTDHEARENEGDLVLAAQHATSEAINFMAMQGRGLICLAMEGAQVDRLGLPPMTSDNRTRRSTAFTVSIEAVENITTGISAFDRAHTIRTASSPNVRREDIVSPGHVFPLRAVNGGVLARDGHTEGSVDLMRLAGLNPSAVICEIMADSGRMACGEEVVSFAKRYGLPILSIHEIMEHRLRCEIHVMEVSRAELPSAYAAQNLAIHAFRNTLDGQEHLAIVKHPLPAMPLVRVHSECVTGEALGSLRCDCGPQLQEAIRRVAESDGGAVVYVRGHEGRGIGLANKIKAYALQDGGMDTVEANIALGFSAEQRSFAVAAQILRVLGIQELELLSNNPAKAAALANYGVGVHRLVPLTIAPNQHSARYLATKAERLGHHLSVA